MTVHKTPQPAVIEYAFNNLESVNNSSKTTTTPVSASKEASSVMVTETTSVIRRSARLAKKTVVKDEGKIGRGNGKQKTKLSAEITFLCQGSGSIDALENGVMSMMSGKRVAKRKMEREKENSDDLSHRYNDIVIVENEPNEARDKDSNDGSKKRRFSRADKGKDKVFYEHSEVTGSDSDNDVVDDRVKISTIEPLVTAKGLVRRRFSEEEKGKRKIKDDDSSNHNNELNADANRAVPNKPVACTAPRGNIRIGQFDVAAYDAYMAEYKVRRAAQIKRHSKETARRLAASFARFSSEDELQLGNRVSDLSAVEVPPPEADNLPGQFATAFKIIKDRDSDRKGEQPLAPWNKSKNADMKWIPSKQEQGKLRPVPSLQYLCLSILSENADSITSLDFVPDILRHKICWALCDSRRMNIYFLELLLDGSPTEIRIRDCSWLSEEPFVKAFEGCNTDKLTVLQFDLAGRCLPDYSLSSTLARSPNSLPALITLSLKGAYRLTDEGLRMLVASAPNLKSVNLSECSMLTSEGVCCLVDSLRIGLRELYLDACHGVDGNLILSLLLKLESLEVLSLAGITTVSDDFVSKFVSLRGCRMKEIVLADCEKLTDSSLEAIGNNCPGLYALDLTNLRKLTDVGICHLANGCPEIQILKISRSELSDEAVGAYLDIRGESLEELSLNNLTKVSTNTAQSLARNCRNLRTLDLSWCRKLTDEDLGLIVDNCSSLDLVKVFGCTQVTSVYLDGYSNTRVKIVGLKLMSLVQHINVPDFLQGPLRYSFAV